MKTIAIVAGGDSSEHEISIKSAQGVQSEIGTIYNTYIIEIKGANWFWKDEKGECYDINKNDFSLTVNGEKITFDAVFVAISTCLKYHTPVVTHSVPRLLSRNMPANYF